MLKICVGSNEVELQEVSESEAAAMAQGCEHLHEVEVKSRGSQVGDACLRGETGFGTSPNMEEWKREGLKHESKLGQEGAGVTIIQNR